MSITDDEFTCLMIAARGEYMLAIGRWEVSIKSLVAKGLMRSEHIAGGPQYTITKAGRDAITEREQEETRQLTAAGSNMVAAQRTARDLVETVAKALAECAKMSALVTGDTPETSARKWSPLILERALDIINNG